MLKKAFSLMELMIVIIILGILASLVMPNLIGKGEQAKQKLVCIQMKTISESLKMFKMEQGNYPDTEMGLKALIKNPDPEKYTSYPKGGYLDSKTVPKDPWKHPVIYVLSDDNFDLISLGADGKEGGKNENKDILFSKCSQ
jgi:general secretion pathway protein G